MVAVVQRNFRIRNSYGQLKKVIEIPNLIDIQKQSYTTFLQMNVPAEERQDTGLQGVFKSVFPIKDFNETCSLEFVSYHLERPKYDVEECHQRGMTYAAPLKVVIRLVVWDKGEEEGAMPSIRDVKEQEVYFGEIPLQTAEGTFIINGTERVVVSQLHRSPGAFFDHDRGKTHSSGKLLYSARVIPYRGSWLDFEFDAKDVLHVRIDRRRKLPATIMLRALGLTTSQLLSEFYETEVIHFSGSDTTLFYREPSDLQLLRTQKASLDVEGANGDVIVKKNRKFTASALRKMKAAEVTRIPALLEEVVGKVLADDVVDLKTGEVLAECNEEVTEATIEKFREHNIEAIDTLFIDNLHVGPFLRKTALVDKVETPDQAVLEIYKRLRPGDPPTLDTAYNLFNNLFFNPERYDLSQVGRLKLNHKFRIDESLENSVLTKKDIIEVVRYLIALRDGRSEIAYKQANGKNIDVIVKIDDIDHLGNRRVRAVGELMENQYRIGLVRMERAVKERMSMSQEIETLMPHDLINAKPVSAVVKEYFGSSQLSQFMDQTNPLSEVTHKRRLSALGPGGLTRERAGFEVRDVHMTHYGRICPIETPEGPNIGLIASLSSYARVNNFGFIETPYREVTEGVVSTDEPRYYSALDEEGHLIAQANATLDGSFKLVDETVSSRQSGDFVMVPPERIDLMDVSPNQLVSVAASLVPFLENDDANRALMGSNMQRQAVPLLVTSAPLVGTGIEPVVARDSGVTAVARNNGVVESVDATRIVVKVDSDNISTKPDIYNLLKFRRSNQNTCINQRPIVEKGDRIQRGDVIADGPGTDTGELALGRNMVVAFMPWGGYNFEDSILISEKVVKEDQYTSIHIEEFECVARDTKLGKEEITKDIPNVGEEALANLDESGIVRIGAEVKSGDILVGKITPKGETQLSPEEKLLRAIFGEKAGDVRDTSSRVPPGVVGTVISAKVFSRRGIEKDERAQDIEDAEIAKLEKDQNDQIKIIRKSAYRKVEELLTGQMVSSRLVDDQGDVLIDKGQELTSDIIKTIPQMYWNVIDLDRDTGVPDKIERIVEDLREEIQAIRVLFQEKINKLKKGDELPPGVIKMVKVYVAIKRKLQVGDKMAGRHGNKGVISRILPEEDMPFLIDGTPVEMVLNPLGVPSRMNIGQVLETHLGWAARGLGRRIQRLMDEQYSTDALKTELKKYYTSAAHHAMVDEMDDADVRRSIAKIKKGMHIATPVFDGAPETKIREALELAGMNVSGQSTLFDGRNGRAFDGDVTVGVMYMLKLHHLVDDKIHARSIGPYSLVTQQPLGGKAQFGGQRLGEMEVWALEAYGAAYALQEFLTVKSDDVLGRTRMYEAIVKGENVLESGLPESFNVLIKELQSLALDIELIETEQL
ncbi:MAG: DNA-directed RNA polymerase subunit beta [Myxococcales bacterium]|nr:DNA-directed RNA polymerase subunit beta [Myxococcales bacterium]